MSESKEHKKQYNQKLEYIAKFEKWLDKEPPIIKFFAWLNFGRVLYVLFYPKQRFR